MKTYNFIAWISFIFLVSMAFMSCNKEDDETEYGGSISNSSFSKPKFEKNLTSSNVGMCAFKCRFSNGGDKRSNMKCKVYYEAYSSKPSRAPRSSDLSNVKSLGTLSSESTASSTTFYHLISSHGGYTLYYMFECSNSGQTAQSSIMSITVKK